MLEIQRTQASCHIRVIVIMSFQAVNNIHVSMKVVITVWTLDFSENSDVSDLRIQEQAWTSHISLNPLLKVTKPKFNRYVEC